MVQNAELELRPVTEGDIPLLHGLIRELAAYEKMEEDVRGDAETLRHSLFERNAARAVIAYAGDEPVGMAIWFYNFSTFEGKPGLYLEDVYIRPEHRRKGYGKIILHYLAKLAVEQDCARMEWSVLNWNAPAIDFYQKLGAKPMDEWTVYRLDGPSLQAAAEEG